jgi:hypothetical protein
MPFKPRHKPVTGTLYVPHAEQAKTVQTDNARITGVKMSETQRTTKVPTRLFKGPTRYPATEGGVARKPDVPQSGPK